MGSQDVLHVRDFAVRRTESWLEGEEGAGWLFEVHTRLESGLTLSGFRGLLPVGRVLAVGTAA